MICKICNTTYKNYNSLAKHISHTHKEINRKDYYDKYVRIMSSICKCGASKKFRNLQEGYRTYCSIKCRSMFHDMKGTNLGKKQNKSVINRRISNTNQKTKEQKRKSTMMKRYGVDNPAKLTTFKEKARKTSIKKYGTNWPIQSKSVFEKRPKFGKTWKTVTIDEKEFFVQGYEDIFLEQHNDFNISIDELIHGKSMCPSFSWKDDQNIEHKYYPDFYVPSKNLIIEIKSTWTYEIHLKENKQKFASVINQGYQLMCVIYSSRRNKKPKILFTNSASDFSLINRYHFP